VAPDAWSDVIFLKWTQACSAQGGVPVSRLEHVFTTLIINGPTINTLVEAVGSRDTQLWEERAIFTPTPANGVETADNRAFYALLYTPLIRGLSWWLVQHKTQMGLRYIDSVSAWKDDSGGWNLYVHVATYNP
jgi:hypothetical protein